jgi:hypothetical protein
MQTDSRALSVQAVMSDSNAEPVACTMHVYRAAQNARMYRIAARDLRKAGMVDKARRMERNARACERAILKLADSIIDYARVTAVPAHYQRPRAE